MHFKRFLMNIIDSIRTIVAKECFFRSFAKQSYTFPRIFQSLDFLSSKYQPILELIPPWSNLYTIFLVLVKVLDFVHSFQDFVFYQTLKSMVT